MIFYLFFGVIINNMVYRSIILFLILATLVNFSPLLGKESYRIIDLGEEIVPMDIDEEGSVNCMLWKNATSSSNILYFKYSVDEGMMQVDGPLNIDKDDDTWIAIGEAIRKHVKMNFEDTEIKVLGKNVKEEAVGYTLEELGPGVSNRTAFFWSPITGFKYLASQNSSYSSRAKSINSHSQVVGFAGKIDYKKDIEDDKAFIWDPKNKLRYLEDLISKNDGWTKLTNADKINNQGMIIGSGLKDREDHGFLLIPLND